MDWTSIFTVYLQPVLISIALASIPVLGGVITTYAAKHLGAGTSQVVTNVWNEAAAMAAGWLNAHRTSTGALTVTHPDVQAAVDYFKKSFPDAIARVQPTGDSEIANDILGQFGKMFGGLVSGVVTHAHPVKHK